MNDSALPGIFVGLGTIGLIIVALTSLFWLWMLVDCVTSTQLDGTQKIIWLLVIFFLHFVGAIVYYFAGRGGGKSLPGA